MKKEISINLLDGLFEPDEAREIVLNMINNKINFLEIKNLSSEERFGMPDTESRLKARELRALRENLLSLMSRIDTENANVALNSTLQLKIV